MSDWTRDSDHPDEWHTVMKAAYDLNHLYETVETQEAKDHIQDAVLSLQSALEADHEATDD